MKRESILLLGGTGLLSTDILKLCENNDWRTYVINRGTNNSKINKNTKIFIADFKQSLQVNEVVKDLNFDVIIDFLSRTPEDIKRVYPIFKNKCKQYVFISTACVYRRAKEDGVIHETSPKPNSNWIYSIEKYEAEKILEKLAKKESKIFTIIRPYITYNKTRIPYGIAPEYKYHFTFIKRILFNKPIFTWDGGKTICTLTHTKDFANAVFGLLLNEKAFNEDFHITSNETCTWHDFLKIFYDCLEKELNVIDIPTKNIIKILPEYEGLLLGDRALDAEFDNSKLLKALPDFNFKISIREGLTEAIKDYFSTENSNLIDYQFDGKIDRIIAKQHYTNKKVVGFIDYLNKKKQSDKVIYYLFRHLPSKYANRLNNLLQKKGYFSDEEKRA